MVFGLSRGSIHAEKDPHDWNSWDHYRTIHEIRLSQHPFVADQENTPVFQEGDGGDISLTGRVYCQRNVVLEVEKWFHAQYFGDVLRVRCHSYAYIGWLAGEHLLLKYHNLHSNPDEYHHRVYDSATGEEVFHEVLERRQFPTFTEVLDELEVLTRGL